jgi:hypothetical protein
MYKSDKAAFSEAFLLFQLGVVALESLKSVQYADIVKEAMKKSLDGKDSTKILKRCQRVTHEIIEPAVANKAEKLLSGHKMILFLHSLAEAIIESGYPLPEYVVTAFEPFLEVEHDQPLPDQDWKNLKASAEKSARKVLDRLREAGYFLV